MNFKQKSVAFIERYQREMSPRKPKYCMCKYTPSCSEYTKQAISKHGAFIGWIMGTWRILRCNPMSKGGFDPVK